MRYDRARLLRLVTDPAPRDRPSLVTGLYFQRSKLALIGSRGIEIMDLDSMRSVLLRDIFGLQLR